MCRISWDHLLRNGYRQWDTAGIWWSNTKSTSNHHIWHVVVRTRKVTGVKLVIGQDTSIWFSVGYLKYRADDQVHEKSLRTTRSPRTESCGLQQCLLTEIENKLCLQQRTVRNQETMEYTFNHYFSGLFYMWGLSSCYSMHHWLKKTWFVWHCWLFLFSQNGRKDGIEYFPLILG